MMNRRYYDNPNQQDFYDNRQSNHNSLRGNNSNVYDNFSNIHDNQEARGQSPMSPVYPSDLESNQHMREEQMREMNNELVFCTSLIKVLIIRFSTASNFH